MGDLFTFAPQVLTRLRNPCRCSISRIVESMTLLMEAGLVDGEDADTIESDYVQASCLVTSSTDNLSFATGEGISSAFPT